MDRHRHLMTRAAIVWVLCGWLAAGLLITACGDDAETPTESPPVTETAAEEQEIVVFSMSSDAFGPDEAIPPRFTCDGKNVSPALSWSGAPQDTQSYALIVDDPDAPGGDFAHWVLYNLPAEGQDLPEAVAKTERPEIGGLQGKNDFGDIGYGGPCPPPDDPHRYRFSLYALDELLELGPGASKQDVLDDMQDHVLGEAQLVGSYER
jgi:Raf kinase inhibitor-like YbhB/YbcL family protein